MYVPDLEKDGACLFFSAGFCIFQRVTCRGVVIYHIFKLKKQLFAYEEKIAEYESAVCTSQNAKVF